MSMPCSLFYHKISLLLIDMQARDGIEKLCESLEKDLLRDFDRAYKDGDPRAMAVNYHVKFIVSYHHYLLVLRAIIIIILTQTIITYHSILMIINVALRQNLAGI